MEDFKSIAAALPAGGYFDRVYESALLPWSTQNGATITRLILETDTLGTICAAVESAALLIADASGRNARVMYIAGYAQGIGKRVIYISQFADDFPFLTANQSVIVYSGNVEFLKTELERLESSKDGPDGAPDARRRFRELFEEILRRHAHEHRGAVEMENPSTFVLHDQDMDLALVQDLSRRARELGVRLKLM